MDEIVQKIAEYHDDTDSANIEPIREHYIDLKPWEIYDCDKSWSELLTCAGVHWSYKNEYTKEDIYYSVEEYVKENSVSSDGYNRNTDYPSLDALSNKTDETFNEIVGNIFDVDELPNNVGECWKCGGIYRNLSHHWQRKCGYPELDQETIEEMKGIVMGDGSIVETDDSTHSLQMDLTRPIFLKYLSKRYPNLFTDVRLVLTSEDRLEKDTKNSLFGVDENREYKDMYSVGSRVHPFFTLMRNKWYPDNKKRFPEDLELTPELTKMWFVTDGGLSFKETKGYADEVRFYTKNENSRLDFLSSLFDDVGLDNYQTKYAINIVDVEAFFEYVGDSVPGFEYKWETDDYQRYQNLKSEYIRE